MLLMASVIDASLIGTSLTSRYIIFSLVEDKRPSASTTAALSFSLFVINRERYCNCTQFSTSSLHLMIFRFVALALSLVCAPSRGSPSRYRTWKLQKVYMRQQALFREEITTVYCRKRASILLYVCSSCIL